MNKFKLILTIAFLYCYSFVQAQAPTWNVNPNAFQYSMTVTAVLDLNCQELTDPANQLGAFVGGTLRGTANSLTVINGRFQANMTVYSNVVNGEQVSFRFYDANSNTIYNSVDTLAFQDNAIYGNAAAPQVIRTNNAPSSLNLSSKELNESEPTGALVGVLNTQDLDVSQTHSYTLVSGSGSADNALFSISNDSLFADFVADYETKSTYRIRVRTTDSQACFLDSSYTISILDQNEVPSDIVLSSTAIQENQLAGTTVANLSAVDTDLNETFTYSLVAGVGSTDNGSFSITGNQLKANSAFNFELKNTYDIRLQVTDGANNTFQKAVQITVTDVNDTPTDLLLPSDSIPENLGPNSTVGTLSTVDEDAGETFTYSFESVTGNNNALFNLVGPSLRARQGFDFETQSDYFINIRTTDSQGASYTKQLQIRIIDANDAPSAISLSTQSVNENMPIGSFVATLQSTDEDSGDSFTYSLVNGVGDADNGNFSVRNDSLFTAAVLDINVQATQSIRLQTDDGNGGVYSKEFTLNVKDVNNIPTDINISTALIPESSSVGSAVATFTVNDPDPGDIHALSLVSGVGDSNNLAFDISSNQLIVSTPFDINIQSSYSIRVQADDGFGGIYQKAFMLTITNSNDAPTNIVLSPASFNENIPVGSAISTISTIDADSNDSFSYSFVNQGSNDNASFIIAGDELRTSVPIDFESKSLYIIELQTRDAAGATYSRQLTLNVLDTNDAPTGLSISSDSIAEGSPIGSFVANLSTQDVDATDNHVYTLVAGQGSADNALFRINGALLEVDSVLAFNDASQRSVRVRSTDQDGLFVEANFIIRIKNQNDAPEDITLSDTTANENVVAGTRIALISTLDQDRNDNFTYELVAGSGDDDNDAFMIMGNELQNMVGFDFETQSAYAIRLRSTDAAGASIEKAFTIQLENGNEAPSIKAQTFAVIENAAIGTEVGTVIASDVDAGDSLSFRIVGSIIDFQLEAASGKLVSNRTFDYEVKKSYQLQIEVSDASGLKDTAEVEVIIEDQIEQTLPVASYFSPNGDGRNDTWVIQNVELYSNYRLNIFSANGDLVFDKEANYSNDWDGTFAGEQLPDGIYYYYFEDNQNAANNYRGTITLKR